MSAVTLSVHLREQTPNKPLNPLEREFLKLVLSKQGQRVVVKDGYLPLPAKVVEQELRKLQQGKDATRLAM